MIAAHLGGVRRRRPLRRLEGAAAPPARTDAPPRDPARRRTSRRSRRRRRGGARRAPRGARAPRAPRGRPRAARAAPRPPPTAAAARSSPRRSSRAAGAVASQPARAARCWWTASTGPARRWAGGHPTPAQPSWVAIDVGRRPHAPPRLVDLVRQPRLHRPEVRRAGGLPDRDLGRLHGRRGRHLAHRRRRSTGNPVRTRAHAVDFAGQRWVRLVVTAALARRLRVGALPRRDRRARPLARRRRRLGLLRRQHHLRRLRPGAGAPAELPGGHRARATPATSRRSIGAGLRQPPPRRRASGASTRCSRSTPTRRWSPSPSARTTGTRWPSARTSLEVIRKVRAAGKIPIVAAHPLPRRRPVDFAGPAQRASWTR